MGGWPNSDARNVLECISLKDYLKARRLASLLVKRKTWNVDIHEWSCAFALKAWSMLSMHWIWLKMYRSNFCSTIACLQKRSEQNFVKISERFIRDRENRHALLPVPMRYSFYNAAYNHKPVFCRSKSWRNCAKLEHKQRRNDVRFVG